MLSLSDHHQLSISNHLFRAFLIPLLTSLSLSLVSLSLKKSLKQDPWDSEEEFAEAGSSEEEQEEEEEDHTQLKQEEEHDDDDG